MIYPLLCHFCFEMVVIVVAVISIVLVVHVLFCVYMLVVSCFVFLLLLLFLVPVVGICWNSFERTSLPKSKMIDV